MKHRTIKDMENKDGAWFVTNGYAHPETLIDHDADLDETEALLGMFAAYNQHHIANGTPWNTWPDWELCLTSMPHEIQFLSEANEAEKARMAHWLQLMQFIHDSPQVTVDGYTVQVKGSHGTTFAFDLSLDLRAWVRPGDMAKHMQMLEDGSRPREWMRLYGGNGGVVYAGMHVVGHSLGSFWYVPDHVPHLGGRATQHTADEEICIEPNNASLALAMTSLIHLCIDDTQIWLMNAEKDIHEQVRAEWWNEHWPQGRPEDFLCQYTKDEWEAIQASWWDEARDRIHAIRRQQHE